MTWIASRCQEREDHPNYAEHAAGCLIAGHSLNALSYDLLKSSSEK